MSSTRKGMRGIFETDQQVLSESDFAALLTEEFPELAEDLAEDEGLLHVQVGAIENLANTWIRAGDLPKLKRAFEFFAYLGRHSRQLHPNVLNAIHVSFLEGLAFEHPKYGSQAKEALPDVLRDMWEAQMEHNRKIGWLR